VTVDSERETFMKSLAALGTVVVTTFLANSPVQAHHSFAMFDETKNVVLKGTVAEFQWTNPHSWILMMVSNTQGQPEPWAIQLDAPGALARQGWFPKSLTPGMKVTAVIHPLKYSRMRGGKYVAVTFPDGTVMGQANLGNDGGAQ
jgi:hypothetical protein